MKASLLPTLPASACTHKFLPKNSLESRLSTPALKQALAREVESVYWEYTLTPEALQIKASEELDVLVVMAVKVKSLRSPLLSVDLLADLDASIPYRTIYLLQHGDSIQVALAYKFPDPKRSPFLKAGTYSFSELLSRDALPSFLTWRGLTLADVYESLLTLLVGKEFLFRREGESLAEAVSRADALKRLREEYDKLHRRMLKESQPRRKQMLFVEVQSITARINSLSKQS